MFRIVTCLLIVGLTIVTSTKIRMNTPQRDYGHKQCDPYFSPLDIREDENLIANNQDYPNLRIHADYSTFGSDPLSKYVQHELMPPVLDYFRAALKLKRPLIDPIRVPDTQDLVCGISIPQILQGSGVETDLVIIASFIKLINSTCLAEAFDCHRSNSGRTIIAKLEFNTEYPILPNGDVFLHEHNVNLAIHEVMHTLGFSKSSFSYFLGADGNRRENPLKRIPLGGRNRTILDLEPLTWRLREHFQSPLIPGALMEDNGSTGTIDGHFEKSMFLYETMTSGLFQSQRISEFSLAVLEGSGWYAPDYNYTEPFFFGRGGGYDFWQGPQTQDRPKEFCVQKGSRGCSPTGQGGAYCWSNFKHIEYNFFYADPDLDCGNPAAEQYSRLTGIEVFGRGTGSKCFTGSLSTDEANATQTNFCLKFTCQNEGINTVLDVKLGIHTVHCRQEGQVKIPGYSGIFDCPDPINYCSTVAKQHCPKNCMGRGDCVNSKCICRSGFTGHDCSINMISNTVLKKK